MVCVEPSPAMRAQFEKKLSTHPDISKNIELVPGDAMSFNLDRAFPAAFLSGTFDHFLNDEERLQSLKNIGKHLKPNGKVIFDVFMGLMKDSPLSPAGKVKKGDTEYRRFVGNRLLPDGKMETLLVFETYQSGKLKERIEEKSVAGIIHREHLHQLLEKSGFEVKNEFANYDFAKYKEGNSLLIIEAVKK